LLLPLQTIAAAFSHKSPFAAPLEKQDELERIKAALAAPAAATAADAAAAAAGSDRAAAAAARAGGLAAGQQSDQLLLIAAFEMWRLTGAAAGDKAAAQVNDLPNRVLLL
jgi:ATP-dependent RNA helicase DHX29